jgi:hypothetical protein
MQRKPREKNPVASGEWKPSAHKCRRTRRFQRDNGGFDHTRCEANLSLSLSGQRCEANNIFGSIFFNDEKKEKKIKENHFRSPAKFQGPREPVRLPLAPGRNP